LANDFGSEVIPRAAREYKVQVLVFPKKMSQVSEPSSGNLSKLKLNWIFVLALGVS
jgi:hypothetical protein